MYGTAITARSQYGVLMMALLACFLVIVPSNSPKIDFFPFKIDFSIPHYIHHPPHPLPFLNLSSVCLCLRGTTSKKPNESPSQQATEYDHCYPFFSHLHHALVPQNVFRRSSSPIFILSMTFMLLSPPVESNQLLWRDSIRLDVFIMDMSVPICPLDNLKLIWHLPPNWKQLGK